MYKSVQLPPFLVGCEHVMSGHSRSADHLAAVHGSHSCAGSRQHWLNAAVRFMELRSLLLNAPEQVLALPLRHWTKLEDRGLPLVLLDCPIKDVIGMSFDSICVKPSLGIKKIQAMLELLSRASIGVIDAIDRSSSDDQTRSRGTSDQLDELSPSEHEWRRWHDRLRDQALVHEPLGRVVQSLRNVPQAMWHTPRSTYCNLRLSDLCRLPAHGKKRVALIVRTFRVMNSILRSIEDHRGFVVLPLPKIRYVATRSRKSLAARPG